MSPNSTVFEDKLIPPQTISLIVLFFQNTSVRIVETELYQGLKNAMIGTQMKKTLVSHVKTSLANVKQISMENQFAFVETIKSTTSLGMIPGNHVTMET